MPLLRRPDGADIHWEETGEGQTVLVSNTFNLAPVEELAARMSSSRRVITYEPRGIGRSTRTGPYDMETGAADLEAVLEETGPAAAVFGIGDGAHRALIVAGRRPDLIEQVVITSTGLGRAGAAGFSGSTEVLTVLRSLMKRDYRSGLRSMVAGSADEAAERGRVEELTTTIPQDAAIGYINSWIAAESGAVASALGSRLTIMGYAGNYWFPLEMYQELRTELAEANYVEVEDGPMNRPALSADVLLRATA